MVFIIENIVNVWLTEILKFLHQEASPRCAGLLLATQSLSTDLASMLNGWRLTAFSLLKAWLAKDYERNKLNIVWGGRVGLVAHPLYYLFCVYVLTGFYDSAFFRLSSAVLAVPLLFQSRMTEAQKPWLNLYWYVWLIYVLPVTFTYILLANHLTPMWLICETMMIFITMILTGSFSLVLMILGVGIPIGCVSFGIATGQALPWSYELFTYCVPLPMVLCSGVIFTASTKKSAALYAKNKATIALAGSIAHEMRNPLSQIKASLLGIERALPMPATAQQATTLSTQQLKSLYQYVAVGKSAIQRGSQVITMILDEVAAKPVNAEHFSYLHATQTTQKAIAEYGYETEGERDKVNIKIKRDFIFKGDETLTLFVLFNLIKNALYYFKIKPSANITITINQPTIIVRDTGPGIPSARLPHLFESFQTSGKQGGTGLGLAYCKRVMQAFGGDITCHSVPGEFTEFTLRFPEVSQSTWLAYENNAIKQARSHFKNKRILVVDDDESLRIMTQSTLNDLGAHIDQAEDGQVALQKLANNHYDLIVMDLNMPVLDGYAAAEKIRAGAVPGHEQIPIIAYTTESAYMAQVKTQKVGINRFVSKPCEPLVLIQTLAQALIEAATTNKTKPMPAHALLGKIILIADDGECNRDLLKSHLQDWGATVLEAQHGAEVIAHLEANRHCDAILLDMRMPGMDGHEVTQIIRASASAYQAIPIIAVTGATDEVDMTAAYRAGVSDCISKPVDADVLYEKLSCQLNAARLPRGLPADHQHHIGLPTTQPANNQSVLFDVQRLEACIARGLFKHGENSAYIRQTKEWLSILEASIQNRDFKKMQDALHFVKGSSANIGAIALRQLVVHLEKQTANGNWPGEENWFEKIKDVHAQTLSVLLGDL